MTFATTPTTVSHSPGSFPGAVRRTRLPMAAAHGPGRLSNCWFTIATGAFAAPSASSNSRRFYAAVAEHLNGLAGVTSVAFGTAAPTEFTPHATTIASMRQRVAGRG